MRVNRKFVHNIIDKMKRDVYTSYFMENHNYETKKLRVYDWDSKKIVRTCRGLKIVDKH